MMAHGLSANSAASILRQLLSEKKTGTGRWRRAFILEKLQFDVFSAMYRRLKPAFSTFFLNSTAHMQHLYWRYMEPGLFSVPIDRKKQQEYESAILEGYLAMDKLLGRMLELVGKDAIVVLSTAMSQQPCLRYEETGGKRAYRPRDFGQLLRFAGIDAPCRPEPVMAQQFWLRLDNVADAADAEAKLAALRVGKDRALVARRDGCGIFTSCPINRVLPEDTTLRVENSDRSVPFFDIFYALEGGKSGMHHPDGILWIRHPARTHKVHPQPVPLIALAPTLLDLLAVDKPQYMKGLSLFRDPTGRPSSGPQGEIPDLAGERRSA
jgi:hypothetical protein